MSTHGPSTATVLANERDMLLRRALAVITAYDALPTPYRELLTVAPFHALHVAIDGNLRAAVAVMAPR